MNYRHIYHAGGLVDLVKHITLSILLKRLCQKPAAFCVIDSHAALGLYDLTDEQTQKTGEAALGIHAFSKIIDPSSQQALADFIAVLNAYNPDQPYRFYPGSPAIIRHFLRDQDRLLTIEKHPEDAVTLRRFAKNDERIHVHVRDAFEGLNALIPVKEKRLFVFIDPPYEQPNETAQCLDAIANIQHKAQHAMIALWYPIKDVVATGRMHEQLVHAGYKNILRADVPIAAQAYDGKLYGSGMVIINPPFQVDEELKKAYNALYPLLESGTPKPIIEWLK